MTRALFILLFLILVISVMAMPTTPTTRAPSYNDQVEYFIDHGRDETGASNAIAAILTDYRGFDTLGETIVLFTSIVAVASVLRTVKSRKKDDEKHE
ncbi:MAG: hydrogen gas-evolving membrane-bound hydrogenase subunit E [Acholeplasmataceae bacterium]